MKLTVKLASKVVSVFVLALSLSWGFTSCDNKESLGGVKGESGVDNVADSLGNVLFRQASAMRSLLLDSSVGVSKCQLQDDGTFLVTLSNNMSFESLADPQDYSAILTYVEKESEKYWALLDKESEVVNVEKVSGGMYALNDDCEIVLVNNVINIDINGQKYASAFVKTDAVQAFKCEFMVDDSNEVYAVALDFGSGDKVMYMVTDYTGVHFSTSDQESISEFYVNYESTSTVVLNVPSGVEYELVITEGWTVNQVKTDSETKVEITAPAEGLSSGELKVVTVGGGAVLAQLNLTCEPFSSLFASATNVVVTPYVGVRKFVYGLVDTELYSDDNVVSVAGSVAGGADAPAGCGVSDAAVTKSITELLQGEIDPEKRYVLWAVPVFFGADETASVQADAIRKYEFGAMSFDIETVDVMLLDAELKVTVKGADAVFGGVIAKSEGFMDEIIYQIDNSIVDSIVVANQNFVFEGLMSDFPAVDGYRNEIDPAQTYVVWVAPAVTGDYTYSEADVTYVKVTTNSIVAGGSIALDFGEVKTTPSTLSVPVSSDNATMIYYAILNKSKGDLYANAENLDKYNQLMANSPISYKGKSLEINATKLSPSSKYWVYAVAVDADGKYGPVSCVSGETTALVYDTSITLKVTKGDVTAKKATVTVTSTGGDLSDYIYWFGPQADAFWRNSTYCGGSKASAQKFLALNPTEDGVTKAMNKYGRLSSDGSISFDGLVMETEYIFIILEKGESGNYSQAGYLMVKTLAADLGEIVREGSDKWNAAKSALNIKWHENAFMLPMNQNMMGSYSFNFNCPSNLTAYVMCASDTYFEEAGFTKTEHIMIEIENYASRKYASGKTPYVNGEHATEPDYYKDGEFREGQLMNVYEFNVHGEPNLGFVTYFATGSHGEGNCIYWENGACTYYQSFLESIERFKSLAPWEERAEMFGLTGQEATDWINALRDAYMVYYKDAKPVIYENNPNGVDLTNPYASGPDDSGLVPDRVVVMLKDLEGNYYEPMFIEVPNLFR